MALESRSRLVGRPMATLQLAVQKTSSIRIDPSKLQSFANGRMQHVQAVTGENFTHLKLTAERMLQEQACAKSELEILSGKLEKAEDQVQMLESKLQEVGNENAMLRVAHKEDNKLWTGLDSKFCSTQAFFDQITETLHSLEAQVQQAESNKKILEQRSEEKIRQVLDEFEHLKTQQAEDVAKLIEQHVASEKAARELQKLAEMQLESKQAEISKHMRELSSRNEQAMDEIKRQYEYEAKEVIEKERAKVLDSAKLEIEELKVKYAVELENSISAERTKAARELQKLAEMQLESKQAEISKHMRELSSRNEQTMDEIKRQYEYEAKEVIEKERAKILDSAKLEIEEMKVKYAVELENSISAERTKAEVELEKYRDSLASEARSLEALGEEHNTQMLKLDASHKQEMHEAASKMAELQQNYQSTLAAAKRKAEDDEKLLQDERESMARNLAAAREEQKEQISRLEKSHKYQMDEAARKIAELQDEAACKLANLQKKHEEALAAVEEKERMLKLHQDKPVLQESQKHNILATPGQLQKECLASDIDDGAKLQESKKDEVTLKLAEVQNKLTSGKQKTPKTYTKRKSRSTTAVEPQSETRKRPKRQTSNSRAPSAGDIFGECLDPYEDGDPYAFG